MLFSEHGICQLSLALFQLCGEAAHLEAKLTNLA